MFRYGQVQIKNIKLYTRKIFFEYSIPQNCLKYFDKYDLPETRPGRPLPLERGRGERGPMDVLPNDGRRPRHREPHRGLDEHAGRRRG